MRKTWLDPFLTALIITVAVAVFFPAKGDGAIYVAQASYIGVALLFFLYGARLEAGVIWAGFVNWKLQSLVLITTFIVVPVFGCAISSGLSDTLPRELLLGVVFLSILPSTVQSAIALTAMARGNVPAAICATSVSSMLGVLITPAYAAALLSAKGVQFDAKSIFWIFTQLLLPFLAGQWARPLVGGWVNKYKPLTSIVDHGSILLIVYSAFSAGMVAGIWQRLDAHTFVVLVVVEGGLLFSILFIAKQLSKSCKLSTKDEVALLFCGSQKSLAVGIPMANILFSGHASSLIIVPLMLYHQMQLFVCSAIAQQYAQAHGEQRR